MGELAGNCDFCSTNSLCPTGAEVKLNMEKKILSLDLIFFNIQETYPPNKVQENKAKNLSFQLFMTGHCVQH